MKLFYLLLLGTLCSLPMKATSPEFVGRHPMALNGEAEASPTREANIQKVIEEAKSIVMNSAAAASEESTGYSLEGRWNFKMEGWLWDDLTDGDWFGMLVGNQLLFHPFVPSAYPFIGEFDATTNKLTISKKFVGRDWRGRYFFIEPCTIQSNGKPVKGPITADYDPATGELKFKPEDVLCWWDYADIDGTQDPYDEGDWYNVMEAKRIGDLAKEDPANWTYVGDATLIDGWVSPRFGLEQNLPENWLKAELYQYNKDHDLYRLKKPFIGLEVEGYEMFHNTGYIEFDVSDPDHVLFNRIDSGFTCPDAGINKFYCYNVLGYLMEQLKMAGQEEDVDIYVEFTNPYIPYTTYKDGIVDLNGILFTGEISYDANWGDATYPEGGNIWVDTSTRKSMNLRTRIYFPDVEVKEPQIAFNGEPDVVYDSQNKSAKIDLDFTYENIPEHGTIFVVVYDKVSGLQVARKYVNLSRYENNHYSFVLDGVVATKNYAMRIQMEGGLSEVIAKTQPIDLNFTADSRELISAGVEGIGSDIDTPVYYNLHGVRIDNPVKGGIYIKVKGDKAVKVIF